MKLVTNSVGFTYLIGNETNTNMRQTVAIPPPLPIPSPGATCEFLFLMQRIAGWGEYPIEFLLVALKVANRILLSGPPAAS